MVSLNPVRSIMQDAISDALRTHWRLLMFQGAIMVLLGILAFAAPMAATIAVAINLITSGWAIVMAALAGRSLARAAGASAAAAGH
jgi:uncharacterized membrane protein HdeD (DUF308 family)